MRTQRKGLAVCLFTALVVITIRVHGEPLPSALGVALIEASKNGDVKHVQELLQQGADVNFRAEGNTTPLMEAVEHNHTNIVQMLLQNGADVHAKTTTTWTPLMFAANKDNETIARILLDAGSNVNDAMDGGTTALALAGRNGTVETIKLLLAAGADVNAFDGLGWSVLMGKAMDGHSEAVRLLIDAKADVNAVTDEGLTALMFACVNGNSGIVNALINAAADVNHQAAESGATALGLASVNGHVDAVRLLLAAGVDVNARDVMGQTALIAASAEGHRSVVNLLLRAGADVHVSDRNGITAYRAAVMGNHHAVLAALHARGARHDISSEERQQHRDDSTKVRDVDERLAEMRARTQRNIQEQINARLENDLLAMQERHRLRQEEERKKHEENMRRRKQRDDLRGVLGLLFLIGGMGVIVNWAIRRNRERILFRRGAALLEAGDHAKAVEYLGKAEKHWDLNAAHTTPRQIIKDLNRFSLIVSRLADAAAGLGISIECASIQTITESLKEWYAEKHNFRIGTFLSNSEAKLKHDALWESLMRERERIRGRFSLQWERTGQASSFDKNLAERIAIMSDNDLAAMILKKEEYTPEALALALQEAERRSGSK